MQQEYLDAVQQAFYNQSEHGKIIGLQWINVKYFRDIPVTEDQEELQEDAEDLGEQILKSVDIVTEVSRIWVLILISVCLKCLEVCSKSMHATEFERRDWKEGSFDFSSIVILKYGYDCRYIWKIQRAITLH